MLEPSSNRRTVTRLTPSGRSAISVLFLKAENVADCIEPVFEAASGKPVSTQPLNRIVFGHWGKEELVVCRTQDDQLEVHCHGGPFAAKAIVASLQELGFEWIEWTDHIEQTMPPFESEILISLNQCRTETATAHLMAQKNGVFESEAMQVDRLFDSHPQQVLSRIERWLDSYSFGIHLVNPYRVVLAGPPNVGKSSLINCIAGFERAIVFDQPGTTRDIVRTEIAIEGHAVTLSDTAGLRETKNPIEKEGIDQARDEIGNADLVVLVTEPELFGNLPGLIAPIRSGYPNLSCLTVVNKQDLAKPGQEFEETILTNAKNGIGIDSLIDAMGESLWPNPPAVGEPICFTERQFRILSEAAAFCRDGDLAAAQISIKSLS